MQGEAISYNSREDLMKKLSYLAALVMVLAVIVTPPALAQDLYDCADFQYQEDAQAVYDQDISGLYRLDGLPGEAYAGKVWPAKDCHKEGLHPELLIPGAGIPTTLCTTASSLTLKDLKDGNSFVRPFVSSRVRYVGRC